MRIGRDGIGLLKPTNVSSFVFNYLLKAIHVIVTVQVLKTNLFTSQFLGLTVNECKRIMFLNLFVLTKCTDINPFASNARFSYPLKTSEKRKATGSLALVIIFTEIHWNHFVSHNDAVRKNSSIEPDKFLISSPLDSKDQDLETVMDMIWCKRDWNVKTEALLTLSWRRYLS